MNGYNQYNGGYYGAAPQTDHITAFNRSLPGDMEPWLKQQWSRYYLKKDALLCGIMLLGILALQYVVSFVDSYLFHDVSVSQTVSELFNAVYYIIYMAVPAIVIYSITRRDKHELLAIKRPERGTLLPVLMMGLACMPITQLLSSFIDSVLTTVKLNTPSSIIQNAFGLPDETGARIIGFISTAILAAVFEEFAFRGVMLQLLRRYGNWFAIICSAILFGMLHGNTYQIPFAFMYGLVMGAAVIYTGSIWTSVILHFINNAISYGISVMYELLYASYLTNMAADAAETKATAITNAAYYGSWVIFLLLGIVGVLLFVRARKNGGLTPAETEYRITPQRDAYKKLLLSPTVIIALALFFISALSMTELVYGALYQ